MNMNKKTSRSKKAQPASQVRVGRRRRKASRRSAISVSENLYLLSLMDPGCYPGAKIPDLVSIPSSTFQTENYAIVTSNAAGDQAMAFIPRIDAQTYLQTAAGTTWTWPASGADNPQLAAIVGVYEQIRPVSMKVRWDFVGATGADQGSIGCALCARPGSAAGGLESGNFPTTFAQMLTFENSYVASARDGLECIWVPQDNLDLDYFSPAATSYAGTAFNDRLNNVALPYLMFACSGVAASTASFRVTTTVNWEALANQSTLSFVHATPSPVNISYLQQAFNWAQQNVGHLAARVGEGVSSFLSTPANGQRAARALGAGYNALRFASGNYLAGPALLGDMRLLLH